MLNCGRAQRARQPIKYLNLVHTAGQSAIISVKINGFHSVIVSARARLSDAPGSRTTMGTSQAGEEQEEIYKCLEVERRREKGI